MQGRRQDFVKGGADARREMPNAITVRVLGAVGGLMVTRGP